MTKLTFNILLSLMIQAKKSGKGRMGNGRILVNLLMIASDYDESEKTQERSILRKFNDEQGKSDAYHKIDKLVGRFLPEGKYYPYGKFTFQELEKCGRDFHKYKVKLAQMSKLCSELFTDENAERLTETLLEIVRNDSHIDTLLYGGALIPKENFYGTPAHRKQICLEAMLLALVYYTHKNYSEADSADYRLCELCYPRTIRTVRYQDETSLNPELILTLAESLRESAEESVNKSFLNSLFYEELKCGGQILDRLPDNENLYIYGSGGIGKTTILLKEMYNALENGRVGLFIPLNKYRPELHGKFHTESCFIPVKILLEYYYRKEYKTYEACAVCESEEALLKQLCELDRLFREKPLNGSTKYVLLLDGINEMPFEMQTQFFRELQWLLDEWRNVRFIIAGRNNVELPVLRNFKRIEACGVSSDAVEKVLSQNKNYDKLRNNARLMTLLKNPLFLTLYHMIEDDYPIVTRGQILDEFAGYRRSVGSGNHMSDSQCHLTCFTMRYALPFAAKRMTEYYSFETDRGTVAEALNTAIEKFLLNERVYQNYIAPTGLNRKFIMDSKDTFDVVAYILENSCIMRASESEPHIVHFVHQYYRDYFAARYIVNLLEATVHLSLCNSDEKRDFFKENELGDLWFSDNDEEIYRLVGEITGEYDEYDEDKYVYESILLEAVLNMSREFKTFRATENVIRAMSLANGGIIEGKDFSRLSLPLEIPASIKFCECDFRQSRVYLIEACENFEELKKTLPPKELNHFKRCDFTGADFFVSDSYRDILIELGAEFYD